jgi:hypothetical protein
MTNAQATGGTPPADWVQTLPERLVAELDEHGITPGNETAGQLRTVGQFLLHASDAVGSEVFGCYANARSWHPLGDQAALIVGKTLLASRADPLTLLSDQLRGIWEHGTLPSQAGSEEGGALRCLARRLVSRGMRPQDATPAALREIDAEVFDDESWKTYVRYWAMTRALYGFHFAWGRVSEEVAAAAAVDVARLRPLPRDHATRVVDEGLRDALGVLSRLTWACDLVATSVTEIGAVELREFDRAWLTPLAAERPRFLRELACFYASQLEAEHVGEELARTARELAEAAD